MWMGVLGHVMLSGCESHHKGTQHTGGQISTAHFERLTEHSGSVRGLTKQTLLSIAKERSFCTCSNFEEKKCGSCCFLKLLLFSTESSQTFRVSPVRLLQWTTIPNFELKRLKLKSCLKIQKHEPHFLSHSVNVFKNDSSLAIDNDGSVSFHQL